MNTANQHDHSTFHMYKSTFSKYFIIIRHIVQLGLFHFELKQLQKESVLYYLALNKLLLYILPLTNIHTVKHHRTQKTIPLTPSLSAYHVLANPENTGTHLLQYTVVHATCYCQRNDYYQNIAEVDKRATVCLPIVKLMFNF